MYCPKCGARNDDNNFQCTSCGQVLHKIRSADDTLALIIPYRNPQALIAYYLAIFSIIPFIGILLGAAALVLGLIGLRVAREKPESRGRVHAWIGILLGGACAAGYLVLTLVIIKSLNP